MVISTRTKYTAENAACHTRCGCTGATQNQLVPDLNPLYREATRIVSVRLFSQLAYIPTVPDYDGLQDYVSEPDDRPPYTPKLGCHVLSTLQHPCAQPIDPSEQRSAA